MLEQKAYYERLINYVTLRQGKLLNTKEELLQSSLALALFQHID